MIINFFKRITFLKHTGIYFITSLIYSGINFFLLPLLTRYLTPADYGIVSLFTSLTFFTTLIIGFNYSVAVDRQFFNKDIDFPLYLGNCVLTSTVITVPVIILLFISKRWLSSVLNFPENWIVVTAAVSFFSLFPSMVLSLFRLEQRSHFYGIFQIVQVAINIGLVTVMLVVFHLKWQGQILAVLFSNVLMAIISIIYLAAKGKIKLSFYKPYVKDVLVFGVPLIPLSLSLFAVNAVDKIVVGSLVGMSQMGVYTLGRQVSMLISIAMSSLTTAWVAWAYSRLQDPTLERKILIVKISYLVLICSMIGAIILSVAAPIIISIVTTKAYHGAAQYVLWLSVGYVFTGMVSISGIYLNYTRKTWLSSALTVIYACVDVLLVYFMVKKYGPIGAAQAFCISGFLLMILFWYFSAKAYDMPWLFWRYKAQLKEE